MLALLLLHLLDVEVELLTLEDVAVAPAALARAGGDERVDAAGGELLLNVRGDDVALVALVELLVRLLLRFSSMSSLSTLTPSFTLMPIFLP